MKCFDPFKYQHSFYQYKLKITSEEINQIIFLLKSDTGTKEQKTTYSNLNVLNFPLLKNLKSQITIILEAHGLLLRDNWAQLYNKKDRHSVHVHPNSDYSGIIYLNPNKPSPTVFYDREFYKYFHKGIKNTLILFPSYIPHEVESLNKNEERLIISFNTMKSKK